MPAGFAVCFFSVGAEIKRETIPKIYVHYTICFSAFQVSGPVEMHYESIKITALICVIIVKTSIKLEFRRKRLYGVKTKNEPFIRV